MNEIHLKPPTNAYPILKHCIAIPILLLIVLSNIYCYRSVDRGDWSFGQSLYMNLSNIQQIEEVHYLENSSSYAIRPVKPKHTLTAMKVVLVNRTSSRVSLLVDRNSSYLSSVGSAQFKPLDPYKDREGIVQISQSKEEFLPFLWGTVELQEGFQIEGWMFFETPEQTKLSSFTWTQADYIRDFFDR